MIEIFFGLITNHPFFYDCQAQSCVSSAKAGLIIIEKRIGSTKPKKDEYIKTIDCLKKEISCKKFKNLCPIFVDKCNICYDGDSCRGYPNLTVTTVITVTLPSCKHNLPNTFSPVVAVTDMVFFQKTAAVFVQPFVNDVWGGFCFSHSS